MAHKYRSSRNDFYQFGAVNDIRETEYGMDVAGTVYYPGVSTCTTLTLLLNDGSVIGAHFAKPDPTAAVDAIVAQMNVVRAGRPVSQLYLVGVLRCRSADGFMGDPRYAWPTLITTFNQAFGRNGGDVAQGFIQTSGGRHYRATSGGAAGMLWFSKAETIGLNDGKWEALKLTGL